MITVCVLPARPRVQIKASTPVLLSSVSGYDASSRVDDLAAQLGKQCTSIAIGEGEGEGGREGGGGGWMMGEGGREGVVGGWKRGEGGREGGSGGWVEEGGGREMLLC